MRRSIPTGALLFTSVSAILGSGWLFSVFYTATFAGPASIIAWIIGGFMMILIAFVFAELTAMLPITGSSVRIPHFTHGALVSFLFAWIIWISYAALVATETQAMLQYFNYYFPNLVFPSGKLTHEGYLLATVLMLMMSALNVFSLRWLIRSNTFLTVLKIVIPIVIAVAIFSLHFSFHNVVYSAQSSFMPMGSHGVFSAITAGGIVFAFNGFKQACELAGDAKNPKRALPLAIIGSILITLSIYLLLQIAFLSALNAGDISAGWRHLQLGAGDSPLASIVHHENLSYLMPMLYVGAIFGPLAAGLMYVSSAGRSLYGMSKTGYLPEFLKKLTAQRNPIYAIFVGFALGMCLFAPLPGWNKMVTFLTSLMAMTYAIGPVCLLALRKQLPHQHRPFRLVWAPVTTTLAFYVCTLLMYWSGWEMVSKFGIAVLIGYIVMFIHHFFVKKEERMKLNFYQSSWLWVYFIGITLISYYGNYGNGLGVIHFGWDFVIIGVLCMVSMALSVTVCLPSHETQAYIDELDFRQGT